MNIKSVSPIFIMEKTAGLKLTKNGVFRNPPINGIPSKPLLDFKIFSSNINPVRPLSPEEVACAKQKAEVARALRLKGLC